MAPIQTDRIHSRALGIDLVSKYSCCSLQRARIYASNWQMLPSLTECLNSKIKFQGNTLEPFGLFSSRLKKKARLASRAAVQPVCLYLIVNLDGFTAEHWNLFTVEADQTHSWDADTCRGHCKEK